MNIVAYNKTRHYKRLCELWAEYDWLPCPDEAMPNVGLVAETSEGCLISYLGMYLVPGKIGYVDWAISDKKQGVICGKALCKLVDTIISKAREHKCFFIYSATKTESWKRILINRGLKVAEKGADTFIMALDKHDTAFIMD